VNTVRRDFIATVCASMYAASSACTFMFDDLVRDTDAQGDSYSEAFDSDESDANADESPDATHEQVPPSTNPQDETDSESIGEEETTSNPRYPTLCRGVEFPEPYYSDSLICRNDGDCGASLPHFCAERTLCNYGFGTGLPDLGKCAECYSSVDCPVERPFCDKRDFMCKMLPDHACKSDADCGLVEPDLYLPKCVVEYGRCGEDGHSYPTPR